MEKVKLLFKPYISILFLRDFRAGTVLFLLSFLLPSVGILGVVAIIFTILFAEIAGVREYYLKYGFYLYNSLLVGMGVGYFFDVSLLSVILTSILAVLTFLISFGLNRFFITYSLPILSFPFAIVSMLFYLASLKYNTLITNLLHRVPLFEISLPFSAFFKSLGTILFLPYNIVGLIISLILLYYSRILFFLAVTGFLAGVLAHSLFVPFNVSLNSFYNFNFILIAMALGGVFLIPNIKSYFIAYIAVVLSVILIDSFEVFFNLYSLPVYTLPFNIITVLFILLASAGYKYFNYSIKGTPEKSLEYYLSNIFRFGGNDIKINLPFSGKWSVYQAFDDEWTHKGEYKYAYDFVIKRDGKSYQNEGKFLEDYYAFGESVLSPISGYVVALRDDLEDNFIGNVDRINNWGNYIIIKSLSGTFYVEISHLMKNSVTVKVGDYVEIGQIIGKCGNSGYSPEPHIHVQVQDAPYLGAKTLPFKFIDYIKDSRLFYYALPKKEEEIEAVIVDKAGKIRFNFILDDKFSYEVYENDKKTEEIEFTVQMNEKGEFYLSDGNNALYFYLSEKMFYFYEYDGEESYLKELFKLSPRIPFTNKEVKYKDILPIHILISGLKKNFIEFILSFNYNLFNKPVEYTKKPLEISSKFGKVTFSFYEKGFKTIEFNNKKMILRDK